MINNIIVLGIVLILILLGYLVHITPPAIDKAVAQSFETYLELNGYLIE
jgi:hypothetical protein